MQSDTTLQPGDLAPRLVRLFDLAAAKVTRLDQTWNPAHGAPVFTVGGRYTSRNWTQWTQGFACAMPLLVFDATGDKGMLERGRRATVESMTCHITHHGVHDHGFNNLSTYGSLRRLMREGKIPHNSWEMAFYELAIKASASVQAMRWTNTADHGGFIYSFNGPHSLFIDTMRTIRILALAAQMGHVLLGENDVRISLLERMLAHGMTTAKYNIYYGTGRDYYDIPRHAGRTAHEAIFNTNDGRFRSPNSQQGHGPFSTWTRGLAWAMLGFAEELEFFQAISGQELPGESASVTPEHVIAFENAAIATSQFYLSNAAAADGICYWDTGAPGLVHMPDYLQRPADPFNDYEPVDASASAIAAQGLLRLGRYLSQKPNSAAAAIRFTQAGLTISRTLLSDAYLAIDPEHEGLLLHSIYHRPNGWDYIPPGRQSPCGESSLWGDYHLLELGLFLQRIINDKPYYCFFDTHEVK